MNRLSLILRENFTEEQQKLFESIVGGKRGAERPPEAFLSPEGGMKGPFNALMYNPDFGEAMQNLGGKVRFEGTIAAPLRELAILVVAENWRSPFEWQAHAKIARDAGLSSSVIESVRTGNIPDFEDPAEAVVYDFARELIESKQVSEERYQAAIALFGEAGVVELVTTIGYYTLISMILNTFDVSLPPGEPAPF